MATIRLQVSAHLDPINITTDTLFDNAVEHDEDVALARDVFVALNTDRRALDDDDLPDPRDDDRRGWWGDYEADIVRGGWPIGTRLWLLERAKITDAGAREGATIARAKRYIEEALQPFVAAKICSQYEIDLAVTGPGQITGTITIYRGPKSAIALEYQSLWGS